jgi:hypothetical protein
MGRQGASRQDRRSRECNGTGHAGADAGEQQPHQGFTAGKHHAAARSDQRSKKQPELNPPAIDQSPHGNLHKPVGHQKTPCNQRQTRWPDKQLRTERPFVVLKAGLHPDQPENKEKTEQPEQAITHSQRAATTSV